MCTDSVQSYRFFQLNRNLSLYFFVLQRFKSLIRGKTGGFLKIFIIYKVKKGAKTPHKYKTSGFDQNSHSGESGSENSAFFNFRQARKP